MGAVAMPHPAAHAAGMIGPNAITQTLAAVAAVEGAAASARVLSRAGLARYAEAPPTGLVDEREVVDLMQALAETFSAERRHTIAWIAGRQTADYLLANRIPAGAQRVLRRLPDIVSRRVLLAAIARHAWTFAGSGRFVAHGGNPARIEIEGCPICRSARVPGGCAYYAATFERLFAVLVDPLTVAVSTGCMADGAPACSFDLARRARHRARREQMTGDQPRPAAIASRRVTSASVGVSSAKDAVFTAPARS
jgi:divinyl protochlorophyllide a 8-vinyl-reductase